MQEKLLILRTKKRFTKTKMARELGITLKTYSKKEQGEIEFTSDEMFRIGDLFGLDIGEIFLPRNHQNGDKKRGVKNES